MIFFMWITLDIDPDLLDEARRLTGIRDEGELVREAMRALIARRTAESDRQKPERQPRSHLIQ